jgi:glycosyltransferase involved in cell wall biosynthesis
VKGGIAVVTSGFPRTSETFALNELLALERAGFLARIFATKPGDSGPRQPAVDLLRRTVEILPSGTPAAQADVVVRALGDRPVAGVHGYFAHLPAEVAQLAARRLGVPFGFSVHARDARKVRAPVLAQRASAAACVVACNADVAADLPAGTAEVLPHGVDLMRFRPRPQRRAGELSVLAVGRLVPKKGLGVLVEAAARLRVPFNLRIAGDGPERSALESKVARLGIAGRVHLIGALTHEQLPSLYCSCDVVAVPSVRDGSGDRDGLPNVVLEAMASGVSVVASHVGAIGSAVEHGRTGLLVPPGDPAALARALESLAVGRAFAARLGAAGRARAERAWALESCAARFCDRLERAFG